jgi:hypothetical protein
MLRIRRNEIYLSEDMGYIKRSKFRKILSCGNFGIMR